MVDVIGTRFTKPNVYGDFAWMIEQPEFMDSVFIFNDCEHHFVSANFQDSRTVDPKLITEVGAGNAVIRPWQDVDRAVGIPTGCYQVVDTKLVTGSEDTYYNVTKRQGYTSLNREVKVAVNAALFRLALCVIENGYSRVFYSSDENGLLGTSIFKVNEAVVQYITDGLLTLNPLIAFIQNYSRN